MLGERLSLCGVHAKIERFECGSGHGLQVSQLWDILAVVNRDSRRLGGVSLAGLGEQRLGNFCRPRFIVHLICLQLGHTTDRAGRPVGPLVKIIGEH